MVSKKDYIQEAAYFIWLNRGRPENQDLAIWDEATKLYELTHTEFKKAVVKPATKKVAKKTATKKVVAKKSAPAKKVEAKKPAVKKVEVAKIIPMVKKEDVKKVATAPKTKIKIVVGGKK